MEENATVAADEATTPDSDETTVTTTSETVPTEPTSTVPGFEDHTSHTIKRRLYAPLPVAQRLELGDHLAAITGRIAEVELEKAAAAKRFGTQIKSLQEEAEEIAQKLRTNSVAQDIECRVDHDWLAGVKRITRLDTGEQLPEEKITDVERQQRLEGLEPGELRPATDEDWERYVAEEGSNADEADEADAAQLEAEAEADDVETSFLGTCTDCGAEIYVSEGSSGKCGDCLADPNLRLAENAKKRKRKPRSLRDSASEATVDEVSA